MTRLRRWEKRKFCLLIPALTRWANLCRAYGAGRNANSPFSSQRLRAGLNRATPTAFVGQPKSGHGMPCPYKGEEGFLASLEMTESSNGREAREERCHPKGWRYTETAGATAT